MNVDALMTQIRVAVDRELESCANDLLAKSKLLTPKGDDVVRKSDGSKTHNGGKLAEAGYIKVQHISEDIRRFVVVYDTRKTDSASAKSNFNYAIIQHEKPFPHKQGQWKFLETPFKESRTGYKKRLSAVIGKGLGEVTLEGGFKFTTNKTGNTTTKVFD